jgi:hypothetical protein
MLTNGPNLTRYIGIDYLAVQDDQYGFKLDVRELKFNLGEV